MSRKPYIRPVSKTRWWLTQPRFIRYMAREVSCVFIGLLCLILLYGFHALSQGPLAWQTYIAHLQAMPHPLLLVLILLFSCYHTTSWFSTVPQAMPIQLGEKFVPGSLLIALHYAGLAFISLVLFVLAGGIHHG